MTQFDQRTILDQLAKVNPDDLLSYVDKKGWVSATPKHYNPTTRTFVLSEVYEIIIPITTQVPNYPMLVGGVINILAKLESRKNEEILKEILGMNKPLETYKLKVEFSVSSDLPSDVLEKLILNAVNFGVDAVGQQNKAQTGKTVKMIANTLIADSSK